MTSYTQVFGGGTLDAAQPSYKAYTSSSSITSVWPIEASSSNNIVAAINDVSMTATSLTFTLPPANQISVGYNAVFNNIGSNAFTILDNGGSTILTASAGSVWSIYNTSNSTASGAYYSYQAGASVSGAAAATLAGLGIKAITTTLNQEYPQFTLSTSPQTLTTAHRAGFVVWTGGAGAFTFSALATLTTGWFTNIANQGTGAIIITPPTGTIDGAATKTLNPGDSCIITTNATNMFSLGFGQDADYAFSYITISIAGLSGTYTLSGAELNQTAIKFSGAIAGAIDIIVPFTQQQYWIDNSTTGAFVFGVRTSTQTTPGVALTNDGTGAANRAVLYCDGSTVVNANTLGISSPLGVSQGGTGGTTEATAQAGLNVPSTLYSFTQALFLG